MDIVIKKGNHYSSGFSISSFHSGRTSMQYRVTFDPYTLVLPGSIDCDTDTNKLFGWSYGLHQRNSIRVGWRSVQGRIRLTAYLYEYGVRRIVSIGWAEVNTPIDISISYEPTSRMLTFTAGKFTYMTLWKGSSPSYGYNLKPYFGGNCTAPADMMFTFDTI